MERMAWLVKSIRVSVNITRFNIVNYSSFRPFDRIVSAYLQILNIRLGSQIPLFKFNEFWNIQPHPNNTITLWSSLLSPL